MTVSPPLDDAKREWEIRKLQAEVDTLERPFRKPAILVTLSTALLVAAAGVAGFLVQWERSNREYTLAQIKTERLELAAEKLERKAQQQEIKGKQLERQMAALDKRRLWLGGQIEKRNRELLEIEPQVAELERLVMNTAPSAQELKAAQGRIRELLAQVRAASTPLAAVALTASPGTIRRGESVHLNWSSTNVTDLSISPGLSSLAPSGRVDLAPQVTTRYTITGTNPSGAFATAYLAVIVTNPQVSVSDQTPMSDPHPR